MSTKQTPEAFWLIVQYAERQGWIPIGTRTFTVGSWEVFVNGSKEEVDGVPPYHARVVNSGYIGMLLVNPFGGSVGGYQHTEAEFCAEMHRSLAPMAGGSQNSGVAETIVMERITGDG